MDTTGFLILEMYCKTEYVYRLNSNLFFYQLWSLHYAMVLSVHLIRYNQICNFVDY